jgi:hypothetical protein
MTIDDVAALREKVREMIKNQIALWRGVSPSAVDATITPCA